MHAEWFVAAVVTVVIVVAIVVMATREQRRMRAQETEGDRTIMRIYTGAAAVGPQRTPTHWEAVEKAEEGRR